jgi:hypothetical protein
VQQANYARFTEYVGQVIVSNAIGFSSRMSANHGAAAVGIMMKRGEPQRKASYGSHDEPESRDDPFELIPYQDDEEYDERRVCCNPCDSNSDVVDADFRELRGMSEADAVGLYRREWPIIKQLLVSKEEAVKQLTALTGKPFKHESSDP